MARHRARRGAARALRPGRADHLLHRPRPRRPRARRRAAVATTRWSRSARRRAPPSIDRACADRHHLRRGAPSATTSSCWRPARTPRCRRSRATTCRGCFVYRTIDDVADLRGYVETPPRASTDRPLRGAVVGGGLLGLEAAGALQALGVETHRRGVRAAAHAAAGRRGRRRGAAPADRGPRRRRCAPTPRRRKIDPAPPAASRAMGFADGDRPCRSTSWCSPPASGPATSWPARAASPVGERGGVSSTTPAAPTTPTSGRSARSPASAAGAWAWSPRLRDGRDRRRPAARRRRHLPRRRPRPPNSSCSASTSRQLRRRVRHRARAPWRSSTPTRSRGVYKKLVISDDAAPCSAASSSATPRVRRAAADGRAGRSVATRRIPPARRRGRSPDGRPARRRRRLLLQQRDRRHDPLRGRRPGLHGRRRGEGLHRGRHELRLLRAAGQEARDDRAGEGRRRGEQGTVRALRPVPRRAVRRRPGAAGCTTFSEIIERHGARPGLRHLQAGRRLDPGLARHRPRPRRRAGHPAGHQRPRAGQPAEGRHLLGRPAHPRRRDHARAGSSSSARSPRSSGSTPRSPAASGSTCSAPGSSSCRRSGGGWSTPASSPATPTARRCAP